MNILVTGSNGFIGQHLVKEIKNRNKLYQLINGNRYSLHNNKITANLLNIKRYREKTDMIMKQSSKYLKLWLDLDKKYKEMKRKKFDKYEQLMYEQKKKLYRMVLHNSISSLMLIFIYIKSYTT